MKKQIPESIRRNVAAVHPRTEQVDIATLCPAAARLRVHSKAKLRKLEASMAEIGQMEPIVINAANVIVHGHARLEVARSLGWTEITAIRVEHLTEEDLRTYAIAANRFTLEAEWDFDALRLELEAIEAAIPTLDLTLTGLSISEIDTIMGTHRASSLNDLVDDCPEPAAPGDAVSRPGDLWKLGGHHLICGDATDPAVLARLMGDEMAEQIFTDPPYNVAINGHVSGKGKSRHREFAMASGEMDSEAFIAFLTSSLRRASAHLVDGGLAYVCMDHGHIGELIEAGAAVFDERKTICVWDKGAGGMGGLYRNAYELVGVFKKGKAPHINNIQLGKNGRNRTTVWRYPGIAQLGKGRAKALSLHPTVKPVALVADALLDASSRGGVILDPFGGSGTTLIAAEQVHRRARLVELDPAYVDTIIGRFEALTGREAVHGENGKSFADVRAARIENPARAADDEAKGADQ